MNDEVLFQLAVQLTAAKLQSHFISPATVGAEAWIESQIHENWALLREAWRHGHKPDNVHPIG